MNILIIGAGGVGTSAAKIIEQQGKAASWAKKIVVADYDEKRAKKVADKICKGGKFVSAKINARDPESIKAVIEEHKIDFCMNAVEPDFNQCIFDTCYATKTIYLDCAMTLSKPDEGQVGKNKLTYEKLGDYQFGKHAEWEKAGNMAIVGSGVEPGMADVFAKFASKHLFDKI
ncbi:MAG: saccharopine dehydrogenase NADP-binding domain-containing protein, partial [Eubacteriaceae bacterium]|nr:saccharopine dehydrogenase NADP-binding domain-containing protein [Eubacteriaceae bacterium]